MARSVLVRCRLLLFGFTVALVAGSIAPTFARADDPTGTLVLASGTSAYPPEASLEAVADGQLVFQGSDNQLTLLSARDGHSQVLASDSYMPFRSAVGDFVLYRDNSRLAWMNLSTGATGAAPKPWQAASTDGGYYLAVDSGATHLYDQAAATGAVTDLGPVAKGDLTEGTTLLSNGDGAAVIDTLNPAGYFVDATTHTVTTLSFSSIPAAERPYLRCASISDNAVGCYGPSGSVLRIPLDGSRTLVAADHVADAPRSPHVLTDAYVTDTQTAWINYTPATDTSELYTRRVADGTTAHRAIFGDLLATPSALYFRLGTAVPDAAIYSAPDAASTPTRYSSLPPAPLIAHRIALGPGRVSWRDDSTAAQPLISRSVSSSDGVLTAGPRSLVATGAVGPVLAVSGPRTAYLVGPEVGSESGYNRTLVVTDGTTSTQISHVDVDHANPGDQSGGVALSGTRVAYLHHVGNASPTYQVLDLRTHRTVDTTATLGASSLFGFALWGNYYAFCKADGTLWRKDLSSSEPAVQVSAAKHSTQTMEGPATLDVYEWGDWVAYAYTVSEDIGERSTSYVRNMRTQSAATPIGDENSGAGDRVFGASAGGVEFGPGPYPPIGQGHYSLIPWGGGPSVGLPSSLTRYAPYGYADRYELPPAIDGSMMAWIGTDNLPRVAPLGVTVANRPRALGAALASSTLPVGGSWRVELPTSAALTSCRVSLADPAGVTIQTLPCSDAAAAQGEAVARWDGRDAGGDAVAPGTYTWSVTAANGDGPLLAADGTARAVTGTVSVLTPALLHPLTPSRLLDTRTKVGGTRPAGRGTVALQVAGRGGVPAAGVAAVVLNVTAVHPASSGFVSVFADGTARPTASNLNFVAGQAVPNLVTASVGKNGKVDLYNGSGGGTDLVADVAGYYASTPSGTPGAFVGTSPSRLLDTRSALGAPAVVAGHGTLALDVAGHGPVPATGVSAVLLNVTATGSSAAGFLTVYGGGASRPTASNLNFPAGRTVPNLVAAPVGSDGRVNIYNGSPGTTQIVADVAGYYLAGTPTESGAFVSTAPTRLLDTRSALGGARPKPHGTLALQVAGRGPVPGAGAGAVVLNVTATGSTAPGYLSVFPYGTNRPSASNLNFSQGQTVPNLVYSSLGSGGRVNLYNGSAGSTHLIADVSGYFLA